jgi:hypothetical protein
MQRFQRFAVALAAIAIIFTTVFTTAPQRADAGVFVGISVDIAPPALPVYVQPPAPYANAIWQPGYWGWGPYGYYWVPGVWVAAPQVGYLWTPGYWGWGGGFYAWHPGYWGPHVGFYGGINYGFGYFGTGFVGGAWFGGVFRYNTAVVHVNTTVIRNVYYDRTVVNNYYNTTNVTRVSYNGGAGGVHAVPTQQEQMAATEPHLGMTEEQQDHLQVAQQNRNNLATVNNGRPTVPAATQSFTRNNPPQNFDRVTQSDRMSPNMMNTHVRTNGNPGYHPEVLPQQYREQQQPHYRSMSAHSSSGAHPRPSGRPL